MERLVFEVVVRSKNIFTDGLQWARNVLGRNLPAYESLIRESTQQAIDKLYNKYPNVYDVHITSTEIVQGACEIIVYGKVKVE